MTKPTTTRPARVLDKIAKDNEPQPPSWLITQARRILPLRSPAPPEPLQAPQRILVLGIQGSGLTSFLQALDLSPIQTIVPRVGLNIESVRYRDIEFLSWSTDGCRNDYEVWTQFFTNVRGIIQVVDAAETLRFMEAMDCIGLCEHWFRKVDDMERVPMLLVGNKVDLLAARRQREIEYDALLRGLKRPWAVQMTDCTTGQGVAEGLSWLVDAIGVDHDRQSTLVGCAEDEKIVLEK